jgi:hypothetical protein
MGSKGDFVDAITAHPDLMVTRSEIYFEKHLSIIEFIKEVIYNRDRVFILDSHCIQLYIIDT